MCIRTRAFSLVTYCSPLQIQQVCKSHSKQIRSFAYIIHDKDDGEKHIHLVIRTYDAWTPEQVGKWFGLCKDNKDEYINTFSEPVSDICSIVSYLTHSDIDSIKAGKHIYSDDEIIDFGLLSTVEKKDSRDKTFEIILLMEKKTPLRDLLRIYGKDFLYHYRQYKEFLDDMEQQERWSKFPVATPTVSHIESKYQWLEISPDDELPF